MGHNDHACWGYRDRDALVADVKLYLAEGLRLGQRVSYIAPRPPSALVEDLAGLSLPDDTGSLDELLDGGAVEVHDLDTMYSASGTEQVEAYVEATWQAVAAGYTGLRVAADVTNLVIDPDDRHEFVRYEHAADRLMADGLPLTGLCAYDISRLGPAFEEVACVHPLTHGAQWPFRLHAEDGGLALVGELDTLSSRPFVQAAERLLAGSTEPVTIDCSGLGFIDHRSLLALDAAAGRAQVQVALMRVGPLIGWLSAVLPLHFLEVADR